MKDRYPAVDAFRGGEKVIRIVGHRGARGLIPENTMIGFKTAVSMGIHLLEFDVVLCADGFPVITHNHAIHAPTFRIPETDCFVTEEPKVLDLNWSELQSFEIGRLDAHSQYGKRFPDQLQLDGIKVPKLADLLSYAEHLGDQKIYLMLEIKSDPAHVKDAEFRANLVAKVIAEVRTFGLSEQTLLHSFDWQILEECKKQAPDMPISFLTQLTENPSDVGEDSSLAVGPHVENVEAIPEMVHERGGSLWCPNVCDATAESIERAKQLGLVTAVWTANENDEIDKMIEIGVDAIVTDYPGRVQQRLMIHGFKWSA